MKRDAAMKRDTRVLMVTHYYPPERGAGSHRVEAFCNALASSGYQVDVLTSLPTFPSGRVANGYRRSLYACMEHRSVHVHTLWTYASSRMRTIDRLLNQAVFALLATVFAASTPQKYDVLCVSSPPIFLAFTALVVSWLRRTPIVFDVRDVWPETAVRMGEWTEGGLPARITGALARAAYRRASAILCVTEPCRPQILAHGVDPAKVYLIPNGFDAIEPQHVPLPVEPDSFVVSYAGNLGTASNVDVVVRAAALLKDDRRFRFFIVGDGAGRAILQDLVDTHGLQNVTLMGELTREQTLGVQASSHVCVVPLRRGLHDSVPTKLLDAMALGAPIIVCADGEAREIVKRTGIGVAVAPESPNQLAHALRAMASDPEVLSSYRGKGVSYVREHFDRRALAQRFCDVVNEVSGGFRSSGSRTTAQDVQPFARR